MARDSSDRPGAQGTSAREMQRRVLAPFIVLGALLVGGLAYLVHHLVTAEDQALEACHADGGFACVTVMETWEAEPEGRLRAWELGLARCAAGDDVVCGVLLARHLAQRAPEAPPLAPVLEGGCERGLADVCGWLAILVMHADPPRARVLMERSCALGGSCLAFAESLLKGTGGPVDRPRGLRLLEAECLAQPVDSLTQGPSSVCRRLAEEKRRDALSVELPGAPAADQPPR
jgi:hypothetical protein